jgi:hypothetical protein
MLLIDEDRTMTKREQMIAAAAATLSGLLVAGTSMLVHGGGSVTVEPDRLTIFRHEAGDGGTALGLEVCAQAYAPDPDGGELQSILSRCESAELPEAAQSQATAILEKGKAWWRSRVLP